MRPRSGALSIRPIRSTQTPASPEQADPFVAKIGFAVIGAALTILTQIVMRRVGQRADAFRDRLDELCDDVRALAVAAGSYWALDDGAAEFPRAEALVFGLNHRVVALVGLMGEEKDGFRSVVQDLVLDLTDAATGGNFQVKGRPAEPRRYMRIEQRATALVREVRRFQRQTLRGWLW